LWREQIATCVPLPFSGQAIGHNLNGNKDLCMGKSRAGKDKKRGRRKFEHGTAAKAYSGLRTERTS
jgi:hypothetical protein